jgi:hypothetical protein
MWSKGLFAGTGGGPEAFEELARAPNDSGAAALRPRPAGWGAVWLRRRDPAAPFDEYFLGEPSGLHRPPRLSASQIERGVKDPATLWFDAVLGVRRVEWRPFSRARRKSVGIAAHRVLAAALRGAPAEGGFTVLQEHALAKAKLEGLLAGLRGSWPLDRYWDSFHMDVSEAARDLMGQVYALPISGFIAVEAPIPNGAGVCLPGAGAVRVTGRMDAVLSDRPRWEGARVEIVDFKTGGDAKLSASRMASSGASLQLGVYLAAARHAGASGRVWMLKPGERPMSIGMEELDRACSKLVLIGEHLSRGIYGARTADRDEYTPIFEWPLACPPVASAILESKFSATFGPGNAEDGDA